MDEKKVALITGGNTGIGEACTIALAKAGYNVCINFRNDEESAKQLAETCNAFGVDSFVVHADVTKDEEVNQMIEKVIEKFGRLDILVNNAGITKDALMMRMTEEDFMQVIDVNLKGSFLCAKAASKIMMKQRYGRIINMSSVVGVHGNAGQVNYAASKAGVIGMTKAMAQELAKRQITVNAIAPGFIETKMTEVLSDDVKHKIASSIPMGKLGTVENVADTVTFLASDAASYITGVVIGVDGGMGM